MLTLLYVLVQFALVPIHLQAGDTLLITKHGAMAFMAYAPRDTVVTWEVDEWDSSIYRVKLFGSHEAWLLLKVSSFTQVAPNDPMYALSLFLDDVFYGDSSIDTTASVTLKPFLYDPIDRKRFPGARRYPPNYPEVVPIELGCIVVQPGDSADITDGIRQMVVRPNADQPVRVCLSAFSDDTFQIRIRYWLHGARPIVRVLYYTPEAIYHAFGCVLAPKAMDAIYRTLTER